MDRTMIPMPPIHCVKDRQKAIPCESVPGSGMIDAPVVVNPAADSKNASVGLSMAPVRRYGSVPKIEIAIHASPTAAKPSLGDSSPGRSNPLHRANPMIVVSAAAPRSPGRSDHSP